MLKSVLAVTAFVWLSEGEGWSTGYGLKRPSSCVTMVTKKASFNQICVKENLQVTSESLKWV